MEWEERAVYEFGEFRLDPRRRLLTRSGGERVPLTGKAFDALLYLAERAGEPVTRTALTDALWPSTVVEDNNLSQAISVVRRALGEGLIETISAPGLSVHGRGSGRRRERRRARATRAANGRACSGATSPTGTTTG